MADGLAVEATRSSSGAGQRRRIAIIGAGPGGLCAAVKLKEAGFDEFVVFEKSAGVGGTWYNNRYPGLACDVPSHLYSFSFDLNPDWSRAYAPQPEILAYIERLAAKFDLMRHVRLSTKVEAARWDDRHQVWTLALAGGEEEEFDFVISAQGMFNELNWPQIPGIEDFAGTLFHSARWNADHALAGRTVAVIGTAASAVQFVPRIALEVGRLHLYQRSPSWVLPKDDPIFNADTLAQRRSDPSACPQLWQTLYHEMDSFTSWTERRDEADYRQRCIENIAAVRDPELRRKLTPDYPWGCTRPLFSNEYYPTFNRDNIELICDGISRISRNGVVDATGREREVDTIICATGYAVDKFLAAIEVTGRDGVRIAERWQDGAEAYLGIVTSGFPNMFMIYGPNTNNGSLLFMLECQVSYIIECIRWMGANDICWLDVRPEIMAKYNEDLQADIDRVEIWRGGCHNYYRGQSGRIVTQYPHNMTEYRARTKIPDWDAFEFGRRVSASS